MKKAGEMATMTKNILTNNADSYLGQIEKEIEAASKTGAFCTYSKVYLTIPYSTQSFVKKELENHGYKVDYQSDQRDGDYCTISWSDK